MYGAITNDKVAIGNTSSFRLLNGEVPGGITDTAGNKCVKFTASTITSAIATTNSGNDVIASETTDAT